MTIHGSTFLCLLCSYIAHELLPALDCLHTRQHPIVHRDVKTSNILIRIHMLCECTNPLICVCWRRPGIVLTDFDRSLELTTDSTLEPDPPQAAPFSYATSGAKVFLTKCAPLCYLWIFFRSAQILFERSSMCWLLAH